MLLELQLDPLSARRWHVDLARALEQQPGVTLAVRWTHAATEPLPRDVERLFALERVLNRLPAGASVRVGTEALGDYAHHLAASPDLVLDLAGSSEHRTAKTWRLTYDGEAGERAALAALLHCGFPSVCVTDVDSGTPVAGGRPGSETPGVAVAAFEDVLAGTTTLLLAALHGRGTAPTESTSGLHSLGGVGRRAAQTLARTAAHRIYRLLYRAPHWRVGWRFVDGPDVLDLLGHPPSGWRELPDDGRHFYADPFPVVSGDDTYLFVEDYDHAVGRGVISVVDFDEHGPRGVPRPVLEHDVHLSYPFVLEDRGQFWMIPETSGAGTVELYRATRFPEGWTREAVLLDGIEASDMTPFRHDGRWWMSGTVRDGGSYSDALHLWSADALEGPWRPHARNPVLVDIASARPAGRVVSRGGRLIRPVQDGRAGYGATLALAAITRLDDELFEQQVIAQLTPGPLWPGHRLHTLNRAGRLECIDGSALSPRWARHSRARRS